MFAVIFRANPGEIDQKYFDAANELRKNAIENYGCLEFVSADNNGSELTISYWPDMQSIVRWKKDQEHKEAQNLGRKKWYSGYKVEVVEIKRSYTFGDF